ncbi:MAG: hypothetical protein LBQ66_00720 [Planctomycetaceae bacterium]|nr:hypothetical protein [Planctomycetaceae bacterium]
MGNLVYQHVFRPHCFRLAPLAENVTAWQSVTHLTLPYDVFRPHCFRLAPLAENATARRSVAHLTLPCDVFHSTKELREGKKE